MHRADAARLLRLAVEHAPAGAWLAAMVSLDSPASSERTRRLPGWEPAHHEPPARGARAAAEGRTDDQIARQLGTSSRTVSKHLQRVYATLQVTGRIQAVDAVFGINRPPP